MTGRAGAPPLLAAVLVALLGCGHARASAASGADAATGGDVVSVGSYASANPGSVNTFWVETRHGVVVIDGQRTLSDAGRALARVRALGKPILAIFLTHSHPDHYGGIGVFAAAAPGAPLYASQITRDIVAGDVLGYSAATNQQLGDDYPDRATAPTAIVRDGDRIEIDRVTFETIEVGAGEAASATVVIVPAARIAFVGDTVSDRATPALIQGMSLAWVGQLDVLARRFAGLRTIYPGHGQAGPPADLIARQRDYLLTFRRLVNEHREPNGTIGAEGARAVVAAMEARYPGYPPVAALPDLLQFNIAVVARELAGLGAIEK
ncbi:MAG TPA: MBL fold metallo-hydrolase [Candidatus Acidoferrum sp.]|nr:MBL fold metallo-hydrolase [Candidatus Acidoferrum sp.]